MMSPVSPDPPLHRPAPAPLAEFPPRRRAGVRFALTTVGEAAAGFVEFAEALLS
jgi:hypothetical protein